LADAAEDWEKLEIGQAVGPYQPTPPAGLAKKLDVVQIFHFLAFFY
jgi:hypothetical protein